MGKAYLRDVHASKDGSRFRDARQALSQQSGRQVVEVQIDVVLVLAHASALADFHGHAARDDIPRCQIFGCRRIPAEPHLLVRMLHT